MEKISKGKLDNYLSAVEQKRRQDVLTQFIKQYSIMGSDMASRLQASENPTDAQIEQAEIANSNINFLLNYKLQ